MNERASGRAHHPLQSPKDQPRNIRWTNLTASRMQPLRYTPRGFLFWRSGPDGYRRNSSRRLKRSSWLCRENPLVVMLEWSFHGFDSVQIKVRITPGGKLRATPAPLYSSRYNLLPALAYELPVRQASTHSSERPGAAVDNALPVGDHNTQE